MSEVTPQKAELLAAGELKPIQRVMTNARYEIMSHADAFVAQGVTVEQLEKVSVAEENRVKAEFEAKEKEDPIRQFANALHESAITEDEKIYAEQMDASMESQRKELAKVVKSAKKTAEKNDKEFDLGETLRTTRGTNIPLEMGVNNVEFVTNLLKDAVDRPNGGLDNYRIILSPDYQARVLKAIKVLEPDENIDDLKLYPQSQDAWRNEKPYHASSRESDSNWATYNLKTLDDNMKADVHTGAYPLVKIKTSNLDVIQKIVDFPTS